MRFLFALVVVLLSLNCSIHGQDIVLGPPESAVLSPAVTSSPASDVQRHRFRVVCYYYAVEAWYRRGRGMFLPSDVDVERCTHIHYAYGTIDVDTLLIKPRDPWAEIDNRFYEKVTELKKKPTRPKVLLSIGGWAEPGNRFAHLIGNSKSRKAFINHAATFLQLHGFDGLDVAWFFPVCGSGDCSKVRGEEKDNFSRFLNEMKNAFDQLEPRLMLTAVISGDISLINLAYELPQLAQLDYLNVMTFDYVAYWNGMTGHQSPLYTAKAEPPSNMNVNSTIEHILAGGVPPEKVTMGIPTFGRSFKLLSPQSHGLGSPVKGPGAPGEFTNSEGVLAHYEICDRILKKGWHRTKDPGSSLVYAYSGDQWVSYDDIDSVRQKVRLIKSKSLGGVMVWDIDRDDFKGSCYGTKYPLLSAIVTELAKGAEQSTTVAK